MMIKHSIVPDQQSGKAIEAKADTTMDTEAEAREFFEIVRIRLKNVARWNEVATGMSAKFTLTDSSGNLVARDPLPGDLFKIDIPGPGSKAGNGFDWVEIEEITESTDSQSNVYGFRVRPAQNPEDASSDTAHFYSQQSTSTFLVTRKNTEICAEIFDRNIKANTDATRTIDKIRDAIVGTAGELAFSKIQWQGLADGLVRKK